MWLTGNSLITSEVWFTDHCANLPFNIAYAKACVITCCCRYVTRCFMGRSCLIAAVWAGDFLWTGDGCTEGSCMGEVPISLYIAASTTNIEQTNWVPLLYKWKMVTLIPNPDPSIHYINTCAVSIVLSNFTRDWLNRTVSLMDSINSGWTNNFLSQYILQFGNIQNKRHIRILNTSTCLWSMAKANIHH